MSLSHRIQPAFRSHTPPCLDAHALAPASLLIIWSPACVCVCCVGWCVKLYQSVGLFRLAGDGLDRAVLREALDHGKPVSRSFVCFVMFPPVSGYGGIIKRHESAIPSSDYGCALHIDSYRYSEHDIRVSKACFALKAELNLLPASGQTVASARRPRCAGILRKARREGRMVCS